MSGAVQRYFRKGGMRSLSWTGEIIESDVTVQARRKGLTNGHILERSRQVGGNVTVSRCTEFLLGPDRGLKVGGSVQVMFIRFGYEP